MIFDESSDTIAHYDAAIRQLEATGQNRPAGRLHHITAIKGEGYIIVDVWESQEAFEQFEQIVGPLLDQMGRPDGQNQSYPVHNIIKGA